MSTFTYNQGVLFPDLEETLPQNFCGTMPVGSGERAPASLPPACNTGVIVTEQTRRTVPVLADRLGRGVEVRGSQGILPGLVHLS